MNILPKKRWHVRTKDNIDRVRRDEAQAAAEEKEKKKRQAIAESESRLSVLKQRAGHGASGLVEYEQFLDQKNVNLFEQEEQGKFNQDKNEEREGEKKVEKEQFEKKVGLLKYLADKDELDLKKQPWYKTTVDRGKHKLGDDGQDDDQEVDIKRKMAQDPLNSINAHLKEKDSKKSKHKSSKKHKKSKDEDDKSRSLPLAATPETVKRPKTIEELRAERLKRESQERLRAEQLLASKQGIVAKPKQEYVELDDRKRKYNSQFNPEFSRF